MTGIENFVYTDDPEYIISPRYYPSFNISDYQEKQYQTNYSYLKKLNTNVDYQFFFNTTDNDTIPWGSTYSYTIPFVADSDISKESNQYKQKYRHEHFTTSNIDDDHKIIFVLFVIIIVFFIFVAMVYDINTPYMCLYK